MLVPLFDVDQAFAEVDTLRRQFDALLGARGLDGRHGLRNLRNPLPAEWTENDDGAVLTLDVPGVQMSDVEISVDNRKLEVRLRRELTVPDDVTVRHRERRSFEWHRTLNLPDHVDADGIEAHLQDGVLEVRLPRAEAAAPRKITVQG